ncbi:phosphopyruvate hydratase, partial [Candidatus Micrarchaeota archaeon]|nr:phosphopyruvate hydratase [Candidatus Micrarchaeota archaeon]
MDSPCLFMSHEIKSIRARWVLDSRGNPTVEATVSTARHSASAIVPSGASTGLHEAKELRDGGKAFAGNGVEKAVANVNKKISKKLHGFDVTEQRAIDEAMMELDGTKNKSKLGANAILAVSLACAGTAAKELGVPLYQRIGVLAKNRNFSLPVPCM